MTFEVGGPARCAGATLALVVAVAATGCTTGGTSVTPTGSGIDARPTTIGEAGAEDGETRLDVSATTGDDSDDAATRDAVLLTAVEAVVAGTAYASAVEDDPGGVLALAATMCERLDDPGTDVEVLLAATVDALVAVGETDEADAGTMAGAVLGASVEVRCPQHADRFEETQ